MGGIRTALSRNFKELIAFPGQPRETTGSRGRNLQWFPRGHLSRFVDVRVVSMRVAVSVLRANGWPRVVAALAAMRCILRSSGSAAVVAAVVSALTVEPVWAETLPEALVRTYQNNPQLNAERARQRGTDEGVSQALAGYRPQLLATLTGGLQQVRVLFFDNTIQTQTLRTWTIGLTTAESSPVPPSSVNSAFSIV